MRESIMGTPVLSPSALLLKTGRPFPLNLLAFGERLAWLIRWIARGWSASRTVFFLAMARQGAMPQSQGGAAWEVPVQFGLLVALDIGALVAWRWEGMGAALITAGAILLGVISAIEYTPEYAFGIAMAFLLPGILLWLDWQRRQSLRAILLLAGALCVLLAIGGAAAWEVHAAYNGQA
jgi:hypothetical protein